MLITAVSAQISDSNQVVVTATPWSGGTSQNFQSTDMSELDQNLGASSTIPISKRAMLSQAMAGSPVTLDLTAIVDALFGSQDFTNGGGSATPTRVQFLKIINQGAHSLTVEPGASNPYYFDAANTVYKVVIPAGGSVKFRFNNAAPLVSATAKTIKLTGTSGDSYLIMLLGG